MTINHKDKTNKESNQKQPRWSSRRCRGSETGTKPGVMERETLKEARRPVAETKTQARLDGFLALPAQKSPIPGRTTFTPICHLGQFQPKLLTKIQDRTLFQRILILSWL